ncbi:hypothetical protein SDJN02_20862, partial [Cucurbita argyrosperma subsp. argyrosperma]
STAYHAPKKRACLRAFHSEYPTPRKRINDEPVDQRRAISPELRVLSEFLCRRRSPLFSQPSASVCSSSVEKYGLICLDSAFWDRNVLRLYVSMIDSFELNARVTDRMNGMMFMFFT